MYCRESKRICTIDHRIEQMENHMEDNDIPKFCTYRGEIEFEGTLIQADIFIDNKMLEDKNSFLISFLCKSNTIYKMVCNGVQREHNKKLNNGLPILHKVPPKRDYGRYFCIMAEKGGTSHGGLTEKLSPFFHAKKQEVNAYGR